MLTLASAMERKRIRRMNKKLDRLIGEKAAEKVRKGWALTTFLREAWGSTKEDSLEKAMVGLTQ